MNISFSVKRFVLLTAIILLAAFVYFSAICEILWPASLGGNAYWSGVTHDDKDNQQIALTFDDGPSQYTAEVLDILKANNAKATFL